MLAYFAIGTILYLSTIAGYALSRIKEEIGAHTHRAMNASFVLLTTGFAIVVYANVWIVITTLIASIILTRYLRLQEHHYFIALSSLYLISYALSRGVLEVSILLFIYGMLSTMHQDYERTTIKRVLIRRLPFLVLIIFGYLLYLSTTL